MSPWVPIDGPYGQYSGKMESNGLNAVPLKKPNPWSAAIVNKYAPAQNYGDNLRVASGYLEKEFPQAKTRGQRFKTMIDAYQGDPGNYLMMPKEMFAGPTDPAEAPSSFTYGNSVFMDKGAKDREFGVIAHEARHAVQSPWFRPKKQQQKTDSFGNQIDHFENGVTDRDMANALNMLELSHSNQVPDDIRAINPWMGPRGHKPTSNDLLEWLTAPPARRSP